MKKYRVWFVIAAFLVGTVFLFTGSPHSFSVRSFSSFWDLGHIVYFAILAVLLFQWRYIYQMPLIGQWLSILLTTLIIGVSIELIQYSLDREPSMSDVLRDLVGSLLILTFSPYSKKIKSRCHQYILKVFLIMLVLLLLWPFVKYLLDESISRIQYPVLSGFETPFEINRWSGNRNLSVESLKTISNGKFLKVPLTTDRYSSAVLRYFEGDWSSALALSISLYNPNPNSLSITFRIHDFLHTKTSRKYSDRYHRTYRLIAGWNQVTINLGEVKTSPLKREMDMSRIHEFGLFSVPLPEPKILYIDEVRLIY